MFVSQIQRVNVQITKSIFYEPALKAKHNRAEHRVIVLAQLVHNMDSI